MLLPATSFAQQEFAGQWYEVGPDWQITEQPNKAIEAPNLTGGHFVFQSTLEITEADQRIVIDFKWEFLAEEVSFIISPDSLI